MSAFNSSLFRALTLALLCLNAPSAHAFIMTGSTYSYGCAQHDAGCNALMTTTSLPTVIVGGTEMDMTSPEASDRLSAEAHGMADPVIVTHIARNTGSDVDTVIQTVIQIESQGRSATPDEIAALLTRK